MKSRLRRFGQAIVLSINWYLVQGHMSMTFVRTATLSLQKRLEEERPSVQQSPSSVQKESQTQWEHIITIICNTKLYYGIMWLQCDGCGQEPVGDYYDNTKKVLCRSCYEQKQSHDHGPAPLVESGRLASSVTGTRTLRGYSKVRDCRSIHKHEFPGKEPKIIVSFKPQCIILMETLTSSNR